MSFKETKRKGFNFFRSYYDVFNELPEEEKLLFITALLDRQFLGIKPKDLKGMARFAWISQVNSIDSQVKGFEDKTKIILTPTEGGSERVENTPTRQGEGKGKGKEEEEGKGKESDNIKNALEFLKNNCSQDFEQIQMKYSRSISDWEDLLDHYNSKVELEELEYKPRILLSRLNLLCKNWIKFTKENPKKSSNNEPIQHRKI